MMRRMILRSAPTACLVAISTLAMVLAAPAQADDEPASAGADTPIQFLATVKGRCIRLTVDGEDLTSSCGPGLIVVGYKTRRVMYMANSGETPIAFSGETEQVPQFGAPELKVTVLNIDGERHDARGRCTVKGDPAKKARFTCEARTAVGDHRAEVVVEATEPPHVQKSSS
jgi:hypothetical protein